MTPYSAIAARPMTCSVPLAVILGATFSPEVKTTQAKPRKVSTATNEDEDFTDESYVEKQKVKRAAVQKPESLERYLSVLRKQKWTSSRDISRALHICVPSVNRYLHAYPDMFVKRQEGRRGVITNFWSLREDHGRPGLGGASRKPEADAKSRRW